MAKIFYSIISISILGVRAGFNSKRSSSQHITLPLFSVNCVNKPTCHLATMYITQLFRARGQCSGFGCGSGAGAGTTILPDPCVSMCVSVSTETDFLTRKNTPYIN